MLWSSGTATAEPEGAATTEAQAPQLESSRRLAATRESPRTTAKAQHSQEGNKELFKTMGLIDLILLRTQYGVGQI